MLSDMAAATRQISLDVPIDVLGYFDELAHRAGLSRPRLLGELVARERQRAAQEHDAEILRRTGGDPDSELDAWVAGTHPGFDDA